MRVPGAVTFKRGRMSGSGIGFTYDEQRDTMWILDKADVKFAAEGNAGAMAFTAGAFGYARRDRYMRLEKTLHIDREGQQIDATESTVRLFPDRDEPDYLELRGGSKITGGPKDKAMRSMSATDINIDYAEDGRTMQNATLAGNAAIELAPKQGTTGQQADRQLHGHRPRARRQRPQHLDARQRHGDAAGDQRHPGANHRSTAMTAAGNAQGLNQMMFTEGVEYREAATKTQGARIAKARNLEAKLDPAAGTMQQARFAAISISPTAHARGQQRRDLPRDRRDAGAVRQGDHARDPRRVADAAGRSIDVTLDPRKMTAKGNVRSTLLPPKKPAGNAPATKRPGLLGDKEPVNILSNALIYDEAKKTAEYTGQARLFQGRRRSTPTS